MLTTNLNKKVESLICEHMMVYVCISELKLIYIKFRAKKFDMSSKMVLNDFDVILKVTAEQLPLNLCHQKAPT